ncbi:MAG: hypothetical protein GXO42_02415 [bacterium]|nr:hypothetical protein [bacterium]
MHFSSELSEWLRKVLREVNYFYGFVEHRPEVHVYITRADHHEPAIYYISGTVHKIIINLERVKDLEKLLLKKAFYILRHHLFHVHETFAPHYLAKLDSVDKDSVKKIEELHKVLNAPADFFEELAGPYIHMKDIYTNLLAWKQLTEKKKTWDACYNYKKWALLYAWKAALQHHDASLGARVYAALVDSIYRAYNRDLQPSYWYAHFYARYKELEPEYLQQLAKAAEPAVYRFAVLAAKY